MPDKWSQYEEKQPADKWAQYEEKPTAPAADSLPPSAPTSFGSQYLARLGENAKGLIKPLLHPIDSIMSYPGWVDPAQSSDLISDIRDNPNKTGIANALADTTMAIGIGAGSHLAPNVLKPIGERMKGAGAKIIDSTVGVRKGDVARGSEPGRAYLEGGGGPALTLKGLGESAHRINNRTGEQLGEAYKNSNASIPADRVFDAVAEPVSRLRDLQTGAGGTGVSSAVESYETNLLNPIAAAEGRGGFTPSELFSEIKKPISQNTRWNDPTMYDLNKVRQQTVGRVGDILADVVPETKPLNKIYQGTGKMAQRANERALTGQSPLSSIGRRAIEASAGTALGMATHNPLLAAAPIVMDSVPVKTAAAKGLFEGGKGLPLIGEGLRSIVPLSSTRVGSRAVKPEAETEKRKAK